MGNNRNKCIPPKTSLKAKGMKCPSSWPPKPQSNGDISSMSFLLIAHSHVLTSYLQAVVPLRHQITTPPAYILRPSANSKTSQRQHFPSLLLQPQTTPTPTLTLKRQALTTSSLTLTLGLIWIQNWSQCVPARVHS